jgi:hypothetical protein
LPIVNHNLLKEDVNSQQHHQDALRQAQLKAINAKNTELEFSRQLQETRMALEKEIHRQLVEQLTMRAQKKSVTPDQQALIEKLYLDLRLINPELALATLKASATLDGSAQVPIVAAPQQSPQEHHHHHHQAQHVPAPAIPNRVPSSRHSTKVAPQLVHNQGSIVNDNAPPSRSSKSHSSHYKKPSRREKQ